MKTNRTQTGWKLDFESCRLNILPILVLLLARTRSAAPTRYVWQDSPTPGPRYTNWLTGAHVIQDAGAGGAMLQRPFSYLSRSLELPLPLWRASQ